MAPLPYAALDLLLLVALLALLTLVARNFFLILPARWQPRGAVAEALRYAPLAALLAITVPEIVRDLPVGAAGATAAWADALTDPRLVSALVLGAVIRLARSALWGLVAGTASYLVRRSVQSSRRAPWRFSSARTSRPSIWRGWRRPCTASVAATPSAWP